jgi:PAS domain S-box-containing protein
MSAGDLEARLARAIRDERLALHYQPVVALPSGRVTGAEALARWHDEELGVVPPDRFIGVAESTGLIHDLGRWVLREACREAARWARDDDGPSVSVNVSPVQLVRPDVVDVVAEALDASRLAPERLTLEITETAAVLDLEVTSARLARLRDLGVRVSLDDFGTGFSSITLLRGLPLDQVKIDRSFVAGVQESAEDAVVVRLAIDAAHLLGYTVCAEGVETPEQVRQLVSLGCDAAQGWYFGRAVPDPSDLLARADRVPEEREPDLDGPSWMSAPDLVMALSPEGRIRYASASSTRVLGVLPEDLVGTLVSDLTHPGDGIEGAPSAGPGETVVRRIRHASGEYRWLASTVQHLRNAEGEIREYVSTSRDVSDLVETRQELAAVEQRFRGAFDGAPIGMALSDLGGRIVRVNDALAGLVGHDPAAMVGMTVDDLTWPDDRHADAVNLDLLRSGSESAHRVLKRYVDREGRAVPVEVWAATVDGGEGQPTLVVAHVMPVADEVLTPGRVVDHRPGAGS